MNIIFIYIMNVEQTLNYYKIILLSDAYTKKYFEGVLRYTFSYLYT